MIKKNIFVDLDGTLLNDDSEINRKDIKYLKSISDKVNFYIVTGMTFSLAKKYYDQLNLNTWLITSSGQYIWKNGEVLNEDFISIDNPIFKYIKKYIVVGSNGYYSTDPSLEFLLKNLEKKKTIEELGLIFTIFSSVNISNSNLKKSYWDIGDKEIYFYNPLTSSKQEAIKKVLKRENIIDWYYFGNGRNDIESLNASKHPYSMKNSFPELLKGDYKVTEYDNNNSGVVHEIIKILNEN